MATEAVTQEPVEPLGARPMSRAVIERQDEEQRGRWETRCDFAVFISDQRVVVCDRPDGHKGMHSGRIFEIGLFPSTVKRVLGYARVRSVR